MVTNTIWYWPKVLGSGLARSDIAVVDESHISVAARSLSPRSSFLNHAGSLPSSQDNSPTEAVINEYTSCSTRAYGGVSSKCDKADIHRYAPLKDEAVVCPLRLTCDDNAHALPDCNVTGWQRV